MAEKMITIAKKDDLAARRQVLAYVTKEDVVKKLFDEMYEERDENFGNGRDVRNRFEDMVVRQSNRVAAMEAPTKDDLMAVLPEDFLDEDEERKEEKEEE